MEISLVYTDTEHALFTLSLGVITAVTIEKPRVLAKGSLCDDFYVLFDAEQGSQLCFALLDQEVLALLDAEEGQVLTSIRLPSKAQRILSVSQSYAAVSDSEDKISSFLVLVSPHHLVGSEGVSTQTVWIGQKAQSFKTLHLGSAPFPSILSAGQKAEIARFGGEPREDSMGLAITTQEIVCLSPSAPLRALRQSIASAVTQVGSGNSTLTTPTAVLVDQALQSISATAEVRDSAYFEQRLERFGLMTSGSEVLALLNLLLEIPQPPVGFLHKFLHHAEVDLLHL